MARRLLKVLFFLLLIGGCATVEKAGPPKELSPPFGDPGMIFLQE